MNQCIIIGNLTRDPEIREVDNGQVCSFTVAVNRYGQSETPDFFRVSAWGAQAEVCQRYLARGRKVAVTGSVRADAYIASDGTPRANLALRADRVEFLGSRSGE